MFYDEKDAFRSFNVLLANTKAKMLELTHNNKRLLIIQFASLVIAIIGFFNVRVALFLLIAIFFVCLAKLKPWLSLALFIITVPLSNISLLNSRIGGIPGLELSNLFLLCAVLMYLASNESIKVSTVEVILIALVVFIHGISFMRSIQYLSYINWYYGTNMGILKYLMSHLIKPTMYIVPFLLIVGYVRKRDKVVFLNNIVVFSIFVSSLIILCVYILNVPHKADWANVRTVIGNFFGFHGNDIAIFYVVAYPFVLANFICKRTVYSISCLFLTLISVALLYSRTAYILIVFSTIVLFMVEKRKKWFMIFCTCMVLFLSFSATTVKERFMFGLEEGDISTISAGRVNEIWPSAFKIIEDNTLSVVFGKGRYSIIYTSSLEKGHPHNMYIEVVLDSGVIGLFVFLVFYFYIIKTIRSGIVNIEDKDIKLFLKASFVSVIVYLISGVSGRHFFPHITNSYLWIIMALSLVAIKANQSESYSNQGAET